MILITGGTGLAGYQLKKMIPDAICIGSNIDLRDRIAVNSLFEKIKPIKVIHCAAKVGGLGANINYKGEFFYDNIMINTNVIEACRKYDVEKLVCFLSTCIFPDDVEYPLTEEKIHLGEPHSSNYPYAYAKRMVDVMTRAYRQQYGCNFITVIPNNLFGPNDNYDLESSHVIPAIMRKMHEAKLGNENVILWGDGSPLREFTYSKDLAEILLFLLEHYDEPEPINVGNTQEYSIKEVAEMIAEIVGFDGKIVWDTSKPMGQHRKPSDNSKLIELGWKQENYTDLKKSLTETYKWVILKYPNLRGMS